MSNDILWIDEADEVDLEDLRKLTEWATKSMVLKGTQSWAVHPRVWRSLRMRDLPYFLYRKRRHDALIQGR